MDMKRLEISDGRHRQEQVERVVFERLKSKGLVEPGGLGVQRLHCYSVDSHLICDVTDAFQRIGQKQCPQFFPLVEIGRAHV